MRLTWAAVFVTAMAGYACNSSTSSGGGGSSSPTGYDTVHVYTCNDKAFNVFSRKATNGGGPWSEHGMVPAHPSSNVTCDVATAKGDGVFADIGDGDYLVRAVLIDFNSSCDSNDPDGTCTKRDKVVVGDNGSSKSTEFKVSVP